MGVEQARPILGQLVDDVAAGGEPIVLAKRGQPAAVLVGRDRYARLTEAATALARSELQRKLIEARRPIKDAGLEPSVIDEAIAAARELG